MKELVLKEGLLVGSFLGVVFEVVLFEVKNVEKGVYIVIIFFDSSEWYLSKNIYSGGR